MSEKRPEPDEKPKSKKRFKEQFDDEETKLVFRKHPIVMRKGLILAAFGTLVGPVFTLVLIYTNKNNPPTLTFFFLSMLSSFGLAAVLIFPWWVRWYFSVYVMTNKRFIQQNRSLLQINVVDIGLDQIQMINYQVVGLEETVLHFGTIIVQTYVGDLVIKQVHHPERVQAKMVHILRDLGIHHSTRSSQQQEMKREVDD